MLFAIFCEDKPGALPTRLENRPAHLAFLNGLGSTLKLAGPFLGDDDKPIGSMLVLDAEDAEGAKAIAANDPYAKAGVFASVTARRWNWTVKNPEA